MVDLYGIGEKSVDKKYNADSLQVVFSSSKVVTSIVVAWMVDKGYLSYDERISRYWVGSPSCRLFYRLSTRILLVVWIVNLAVAFSKRSCRSFAIWLCELI